MAERVRIGQLRQLVYWQQRSVTYDSVNQPIESWSSPGTGPLWASVSPLSGRELIVAQAQEAQITHRVQMRWNGNIKPKDRISYQRLFPDETTATVNLNIVSVIDLDELHTFVELLCVEVAR